ncbi:MAG: hypothetical protein ACI8PZ_005925 [Myxococcota bacterium]
MSVTDVQDDLIDAGAQIIWVLEQGQSFEDGTANNCFDTMERFGATQGWCVGDDQTKPDADVWDESEFSVGRGFDLIVPRSTMQIVYTTSHGTPNGNENLTGADVLAEVRAVVGGL